MALPPGTPFKLALTSWAHGAFDVLHTASLISSGDLNNRAQGEAAGAQWRQQQQQQGSSGSSGSAQPAVTADVAVAEAQGPAEVLPLVVLLQQ
jgi:hypothetical protein